MDEVIHLQWQMGDTFALENNADLMLMCNAALCSVHGWRARVRVCGCVSLCVSVSVLPATGVQLVDTRATPMTRPVMCITNASRRRECAQLPGALNPF